MGQVAHLIRLSNVRSGCFYVLKLWRVTFEIVHSIEAYLNQLSAGQIHKRMRRRASNVLKEIQKCQSHHIKPLETVQSYLSGLANKDVAAPFVTTLLAEQQVACIRYLRPGLTDSSLSSLNALHVILAQLATKACQAWRGGHAILPRCGSLFKVKEYNMPVFPATTEFY